MDKAALQALKARHPILDVAQDLGLDVRLRRIRCPSPERHSHGDRTPSVTLSPERGTFKCWVCPDVKGDVIDLVRRIRGLDFGEAVAYLEAREGKAGAARAAGGHRVGHGPRPSPSQTELFVPGKPAVDKPPGPAPMAWTPESEALRTEALQALLGLCSGVEGKAAAWLRKRRIFRKTWEAQGLRLVAGYGRIAEALAARFSPGELRAAGLFNAEGHLRFYRHPLLIPYFDAQGRPVYLQARALDPETSPKELSLAGPIPCPYHVRLLDGSPGPLYLCEGAIDALTLLEAGFPAVGVPGAAAFKPAWVPLFRNKAVYIAFDADAAGEAGAAKVLGLLASAGIEAHRLSLPAGRDVNDWLRGR